MAGVELDALQLIEVRSGGLHELDGAVDLARETFVALVRRVGGEAVVPAVHLAQVGEPALRERAHQVQRRRGRVVALDQASRVGSAALGSEVVAVDDVTAVGRQRQLAAGLRVAGARLGELPRHASHLHDGHRRAVSEDDSHLQQRLDAAADLVGGGAREGLRAVTALHQERFAACHSRQALAQNVDLTGEHERRKRGDLGRRGGGRLGVRPLRLLLDGELTPIVETGDHAGICLHNGLGRVYHGRSFCSRNRANTAQRSTLADRGPPCGRVGSQPTREGLRFLTEVAYTSVYS